MGYTKRQFIVAALEELVLAEDEFDITPERLESSLRRLDSMMAAWNAKGIRVGYPLPSTPENSDLDTETGVPDIANEAIILNLAVRLAPGWGKQVSQDTKANAHSGYLVLLGKSAVPPPATARVMPSGAGHKPWRTLSTFTAEADSTIDAGDDSELEFS